MLDDSMMAIELDQQYFKAHLRHGEALIELGKKDNCLTIDLIDKGLQSLVKAYSLCWGMPSSDPKYKYKQTFEKEISNQILRGKKIKWFKEQVLEQTEREIMLEQLKYSLKIEDSQYARPEEVPGCELDKKEDATPQDEGHCRTRRRSDTALSEEQKKININIYLKVHE